MPEVRVVNHNLWEQSVSNPLPAVLTALYHFVPRVPVSPEIRLYAVIFGERAADRRRMLTEVFMLLNRPSGEWEDYQDSCARWVSDLLGESIARDTEILRDPLHQALGKIPEHLQEVLRLRFGLNGGMPQTLEQVGRQLGVTRERVRQKEAKALRLLRHPTRRSALRQLSPGEWLRSRVFTALEASGVPTVLFLLWAEDRTRLDWLERMREQALTSAARKAADDKLWVEYLQSLVKKLYLIPITGVGLSTRAVNALCHHPGMTDTPMLGEVAVLTDRELLNIRGFGQKTLHEVRQRICEIPGNNVVNRAFKTQERTNRIKPCINKLRWLKDDKQSGPVAKREVCGGGAVAAAGGSQDRGEPRYYCQDNGWRLSFTADHQEACPGFRRSGCRETGAGGPATRPGWLPDAAGR